MQADSDAKREADREDARIARDIVKNLKFWNGVRREITAFPSLNEDTGVIARRHWYRMMDLDRGFTGDISLPSHTS